MIPVPSGVRVWLATGHTDMRKGSPGLSLMVQETLEADPNNGPFKMLKSAKSEGPGGPLTLRKSVKRKITLTGEPQLGIKNNH